MKKEVEAKSNEIKQETKKSLVKGMYENLCAKGITLIALVVTIVILLILAAVSITAVFGENGLIEMARRAAEATNEAIGTEQNNISELENFLGDHLAGGGTPTLEPTPTPEPAPKTVAEAIEKDYTFTENTDIKDAYGNPVTIPAGFKIVPNRTDNVEYTYTGDGIPVVQDGIVIKDEENYFVWVPICTVEKRGEEVVVTRGIKGKNGEVSEVSNEVILGRYTFDGGQYNWGSSAKNGEKHLEQYAINYASEYSGENFHDYYKERISKVEGENEVSRNLQKFVENTNEKGGYWFARYEAVKGSDGKVKSKPSTEETQGWNKSASDVKAGMVWNYITQLDASTKSQEMYEENSNFETDLVNSYAWDTAIVFIQTYSNNPTYSIQPPTNWSIGKTGEREVNTTDKVCNIYDMARNLLEWSTEAYADTNYPYVYRGGSVGETWYSGGRCESSGYESESFSYRPILYVTL